jgi:hypothetical protein
MELVYRSQDFRTGHASPECGTDLCTSPPYHDTSDIYRNCLLRKYRNANEVFQCLSHSHTRHKSDRGDPIFPIITGLHPVHHSVILFREVFLAVRAV